MEITYNVYKEAINIHKHGVSLGMAARIDWPNVLSKPDSRKDYGEVREIGYAPIDDRLYCVVFTQRGATMHIISLRKANPREVRDYAKYD